MPHKAPPSIVRDIMSKDCYRVSGKTSISTLAEGLALHRLPGAPVVDNGDHLIGFISEQDVLGKVIESLYLDHEAPLVHEMMRNEVLSVSPTKSIVDLAQEMRVQSARSILRTALSNSPRTACSKPVSNRCILP